MPTLTRQVMPAAGTRLLTRSSPSILARRIPLLWTPAIDASAPNCDALYGTAPGFMLCDESPGRCAFNAVTSSDCDAVCGAFGGTCITAFDNPNEAGRECERIAEESCGMDRTTELCVCTRP